MHWSLVTSGWMPCFPGCIMLYRSFPLAICIQNRCLFSCFSSTLRNFLQRNCMVAANSSCSVNFGGIWSCHREPRPTRGRFQELCWLMLTNWHIGKPIGPATQHDLRCSCGKLCTSTGQSMIRNFKLRYILSHKSHWCSSFFFFVNLVSTTCSFMTHFAKMAPTSIKITVNIYICVCRYRYISIYI